jgi:hypothetical protein
MTLARLTGRVAGGSTGPAGRGMVGESRRVTVCFDWGGWSPALFAEITGAGFDVLTWRKGTAPTCPPRRSRPSR